MTVPLNTSIREGAKNPTDLSGIIEIFHNHPWLLPQKFRRNLERLKSFVGWIFKWWIHNKFLLFFLFLFLYYSDHFICFLLKLITPRHDGKIITFFDWISFFINVAKLTISQTILFAEQSLGRSSVPVWIIIIWALEFLASGGWL